MRRSSHVMLASATLALAVALTVDPARGSQAGGSPNIGFEPGDFLPDLELPTVDGQRRVRLSGLRGQRLLLVQFASW